MSARSLHERLSQDYLQQLPIDEALRIIQQVGQALSALHEQGIAHGNLTPQTVFFTGPDSIRLGECQLQTVLACIDDYQPSLADTLPRCLYMAPEQFRGVSDARSDQYALGCLAYVLLAGCVPFSGTARATLLQKHQRDEPEPLTAFNPAIPEALEEAVLKALVKKPAGRHSSVQAFLEALARASFAGQELPEETEEPLLAAVLEVPTPSRRLWDWETSVQPSMPASPVQPVRQDVGGGQPAAPALRGRSRLDASKASRSPGLYVLVPLALLILALTLATGSGLLFPRGHAQPQQSARIATPTDVLLTPVTAPPQVTTGTMVAIQLTPSPVPTPRPSPTVSPTPTTGPISTPITTALVHVRPVLDCVAPLGNQSFLAVFGYMNSGSSAVTIPVGASNSLNPSFFNGLQPTDFSPGSQKNVLQLFFSRSSTITWTLNGATATASSSSPGC